MKLLLVFATALERDGVFPQGVPDCCDVLVTGAGMVATAVAVARQLCVVHYEAVLQLGIAGAYAGSGLSVGSLVRVDSDCQVELGVEEADGTFTPWERPDLGGARAYRAAPLLEAPASWRKALALLPGVAGATVQRCTGTEYTARERSRVALVESMEGAAFLAAAHAAGVPCFQVRAISNLASSRDFGSWKIPEALDALKMWTEKLRIEN